MNSIAKRNVVVTILLTILSWIVFLSFLFGAHPSHASISSWKKDCTQPGPSTATSSMTYQTPGTATSTNTCNLSVDAPTTNGVTYIASVNASSSNTTWTFQAEESMDGIDWYPASLGTVNVDELTASTSISILPGNNSFTYRFATSSWGGNQSPQSANVGLNGSLNRATLSVTIPSRLQRVRVWAAIASSTSGSNGGGNGAIWSQIVPVISN